MRLSCVCAPEGTTERPFLRRQRRAVDAPGAMDRAPVFGEWLARLDAVREHPARRLVRDDEGPLRVDGEHRVAETLDERVEEGLLLLRDAEGDTKLDLGHDGLREVFQEIDLVLAPHPGLVVDDAERADRFVGDEERNACICDHVEVADGEAVPEDGGVRGRR